MSSPSNDSVESLAADREQQESVHDERALASVRRALERTNVELEHVRHLAQLKEDQLRLANAENARLSKRLLVSVSDPHKQVVMLVAKLQEAEEALARGKDETEAMRRKLAAEESKSELLQRRVDSNNDAERVQELGQFATRAKQEIRQLGTQLQVLEEKVRAGELEKEELRGMYGLFDKKKQQKIIDAQREYLQENSLLKERLAHKDLQVSELKEMWQEAEIEKRTATQQAQEMRDEIARERARAAQLEDDRNELQDELLTTRTLFREKFARVQTLEEQLAMTTTRAQEFELSYQSAVEQLSKLQREIETRSDRDRLRDIQYQADQEELDLYRVRLRKLQQNMVVFWEEQRQKHEQLLRLQQRIRDMGGDPDANQSASDATKRASSKDRNRVRVAELEEEVLNLRQASQAHQSHAAFLDAEVGRLKDEASMELQLRKRTIQRLQAELESLQQTFRQFQEAQSNLDISPSKDTDANDSSHASPAVVRKTQRGHRRVASSRDLSALNLDEPTSAKEETSDKETIELLKSEIEILRKEYFFSIALGMKLQQPNCGNVDVQELFERLPPNTPIKEWHRWVTNELRKHSMLGTPAGSSPPGEPTTPQLRHVPMSPSRVVSGTPKRYPSAQRKIL